MENRTAVAHRSRSRVRCLTRHLATVTLKLHLHCEQFWTFIVIVTFDLLRTLLRMRAYEQTNKDNYIIDCIDYVTGIGNAHAHNGVHSVLRLG